MPQVTLVRVVASAKGAFGVLLFNGEAFAVSIEHTYIDPASQNASLVKIAPGNYSCLRRMFYRGGYETFEVLVPGHTDILFHKANFAKDVDGCIGVGESFQEFGVAFGDLPGIADSAKGFDEFSRLTSGLQSFTLRVVDVVSQVAGV